MNQKSKKLFAAQSLWQTLCQNFKLLLLVTAGWHVLGLAVSATAQQLDRISDVQQSYNQSSLSGWTPPNTAGVAYRNNGSTTAGFNVPSANQPPGVSFPESIAPFETGIRTANYEAPDVATDVSITDRIDGAAATFSKWKDIASEKASTFLDGAKQEGGWLNKIQTFIGTSDVKKMVGSLALVLGLYFAFVWVMRKLNLGGNAGLPSDVVEVLGQVPFGARRSLQLVRLGTKVLLLLNSPEGTQPLGEISNPDEVEHLVSLCRGKRKPRSKQPTHAVQQAVTQITGGNVLPNTTQPTAQPSIGNVGTTSLNEVIQILQQAAAPKRTVFEA